MDFDSDAPPPSRMEKTFYAARSCLPSFRKNKAPLARQAGERFCCNITLTRFSDTPPTLNRKRDRSKSFFDSPQPGR